MRASRPDVPRGSLRTLLFHGWDAQILADLPGQLIVEFGVTRDG